MSTSTAFSRVVAGVSTMDGRAVARWAAEEAITRHAELRLVTARPAPDRHPNSIAHANRATERLVGIAGELASGWPGLAVTAQVVTGPPAAVLRAEAQYADLLVVGADDGSPFTEAFNGSVPGDLVATAPCPLVVVPRREWTTPASAPVVVALDESATSQAALAYAYATAQRTGRPLTVMRCVTREQLDRAVGTVQALLHVALAELYPTVAVTTEVTTGDPRHVLGAASRRAALLVLGSRGHGRFAAGLFGSVSRYLIRRGGCPVVVARTQPTSLVLSSRAL